MTGKCRPEKTFTFIKFLISLILVLSSISSAFCEEEQQVIEIKKSRIIKIENLKAQDNLFKEYGYILEDNYKALSAGKPYEMLFFSYTPKKEDTLLTVAARCNISYDTIATLNEIENSDEQIAGKELILPTVKGLFIKRNKSKTSLEWLLKEKLDDSNLTKDSLCYKINGEEFVFLPNMMLSPTERAYFLDSGLRLPLDRENYWISSAFGKRKNPFSGEWKNHNGIDLAASTGTPVYAVKDGEVAYAIVQDPTFGNYIILSHDKGKTTSVYAHLSSIAVKQYDTVKKGEIIGYVGQTGLATGPHLHFEIRQGGVPQNPQTKLKF